MDYKDTLRLPNTSFAMRADLSQNEAKRFASWDEKKSMKK